jgi:hypothetical protein
MTSIGLLTVSILFLSNQQTRLAVENGHQMGSMDDRDYFTDHYQPPHSLKADDKDKDSETEPAESQEDSSERRGRQRREKKLSNRKGKRDEKVSKHSSSPTSTIANNKSTKVPRALARGSSTTRLFDY